MQSEFDKELQTYFTDVEQPRETFKEWLAAPALPKRLLIIHGVGGVGKSSLMRMFRLHCKSVQVPVALASGDEQKSLLDVLTRWADDLTADGVALPTFRKSLVQYRALYHKVESEASKPKTTEKLTKEAAKTLVETAASTIPGFGPLLGKLGGIGIEALTDWLFSRGFKKPDVDFLLDPAKRLTEDFLADMTSAAGKKRLVLILDTFEQMETLSDWIRNLVQRLPPNVLLVIAGRTMPDWDRTWHGWMASAHIEELRPMTEANMRELIQRYYATLRSGKPDPNQVEAIIAFARGLPIVVTGAVQLWVKYGVEDFQVIKPKVVANLVDRLMEGVPGELVPALEAAAIVRWFDQPILRALMKQDDVREAYNELRRFPFVRTRTEGLAMHDAVRELIDENLQVQDAERHRELHERAAAYFEAHLERANGEEAQRLAMEQLYHCVRANEETGIRLFQEMAEELARYRLVNRLRALLNDVSTYLLEQQNSRLWREYYKAVLLQYELLTRDAIESLEKISNTSNDPKLRAYALCNLGEILAQRHLTVRPGGADRAIQVIRSSLAATKLDHKLAMNYINLGFIYAVESKHEQAITQFKIALNYFEERDDKYNVSLVLGHLAERYRVIGHWKDSLECRRKTIQVVDTINNSQWPRSVILHNLLLFSIGRYAECEKETREAMMIRRELGEHEDIGILRDLGLIIGMQDRFTESLTYFEKCFETAKYQSLSALEDSTGLRFLGIIQLRQGELVNAEQSLSSGLDLIRSHNYTASETEFLFWLGILHETWLKLETAEHYHKSALSMQTGRRYFECGALTGLVRIKYAQDDWVAIPPLLKEAEQLAQKYEYNDYLASLRLTQGHLALTSVSVPADRGENAKGWERGFDAALRYYQQALIYALRYNRFLLDEVLSGRPQGTPLRPIITECLKCGEKGRHMLIALRDWWQTGVNDIGVPRPDTISSIPEGITLLEAERAARQREPGDGSPQRSVVEQIERSLHVIGDN